MVSDEGSPRFVAKYCKIQCVWILQLSACFGGICSSCAQPGNKPSSMPSLALPHPHTAQVWGRWIDLYSQDCSEQNFVHCEFLLDSNGQLISFALFTYSFVPKWTLVSAALHLEKSVYLICTSFWQSHYTVWILQIQQCASQSRISTFKGLYWDSWREKYQTQTAELVIYYSFFVSEDIWVGYLNCRGIWENQLLILHCDTLTVTNSCCLLPIDFQSTFSGVTLDSKGARCR